MDIKRILILAFTVVVLLSFLAGGKPAPAAAQHPIVNLELLGAGFGGSSYLNAFSTADILKKHHPWLRGSPRETFGSVDALRTVGNDPALRKKALWVGADSTMWVGKKGVTPFKKKYHGLKFVAWLKKHGEGYVTLNPNIKTKEDLIGKRVAQGPRGGGHGLMADMVLRDCYGLYDKAKPKYMNYTAEKDALADGLVDAAYFWVDHIEGKYIPSRAVQELMLTRKVYFIPVTQEDIDRGRKASGLPYSVFVIPAGALGETQPKDLPMFFTANNNWCCYEDVPNEYVYEFVKAIAENDKLFRNYFYEGALINKETLGQLPINDESDVHPGALKYFKEQGMKVGVK